MFQGHSSSVLTSSKIRKAIQLQQPFEQTVVNYNRMVKFISVLLKGFLYLILNYPILLLLKRRHKKSF
jgi:hypothetical protein